MDRKQILKKSIKIFLLNLFIYLFFILPFFQFYRYISVIEIPFLCFKKYSFYNLEIFNIQYIILFIFIFYFLYHKQVTNISEKISFMTMFMNKIGKRELVKRIIIDGLKENLYIFFSMLASILFIDFMSSWLFQLSMMDICNLLFRVIFYLLKYIIFLYGSVTAVNIYSINHKIGYDVIIPYGVIIIFILIDYLFGFSFITKCLSLKNEIIYMCSMLIFVICILSCICILFFNEMEVKND